MTSRGLLAGRVRAVTWLSVMLGACTGAPTPASEGAVRTLWNDYVASKRGQLAANAGSPSTHWSAAEQARWPMYDLAGFYVSERALPEVISVDPVNPVVDSAYRIVTQFWPEGPVPRDTTVQPLLTMTVYARRERRRWVLANALPYATHAWSRSTVGRIAYHVAPALQFNAAKAERAAAFVDSLAAAFDVTPPERIDYYVAENVDQALEVLGVAVPTRYGAAGGFSKPVNAQVFSGIPALGENYRHELVHVVIGPLIRDFGSSLLASEGVCTWFGGTGGRDFRESVQHLDSLMRADPRITLDAILSDISLSSDIRNAAGAVLASMVFEAGGVAAVREFLRASGVPRRMQGTLEALLQRPWETVVRQWQQTAQRIATEPATS